MGAERKWGSREKGVGLGEWGGASVHGAREDFACKSDETRRQPKRILSVNQIAQAKREFANFGQRDRGGGGGGGCREGAAFFFGGGGCILGVVV